MNFHTSNQPTFNLGRNEVTRALRHEDEQKGGQRVPLVNALSRLKGGGRGSIKEDIKERKRNQTHNPLNPVGGETIGSQHLLHEFPVELIIIFCNIKLNHHPRGSRAFDRMQHFMQNNNPIQDFPTFHKTIMFWDYKHREEGFELVSNDFGDDFVYDIA